MSKRPRVYEEKSFIQANLPNGREIINLTNQKTNVEKAVQSMSDIDLKDINVNTTSGEKSGFDKIVSSLERHSDKEVDAFRALAIKYSNPKAITSSIDTSRLSINDELMGLVSKTLADITAERVTKLQLDLNWTNEINLLRRKKEDNLRAYEFISELERRKRYSVNAKFIVACIDDYNQSKLYDINNNQVEEEPFIDDENDGNDNGEARMGDLDLNGEYQHA